MARDILIRVGECVRTLRRARGWTQVYLAVHTGLNKSFISELENGRKEPCLRTLETLAQGFDIELSDLLKDLKK